MGSYILILVFSFFCIKKARNIYGMYANHITIFNLWWMITLGLSFLNKEIFTPENSTYYIFYIGLISFNLHIFFIRPNSNIILQGQLINSTPITYDKKKFILNIYIRRIIEIIVLAIMIPYAYMNYQLMRSGIDLKEIHSDYFSGDVIQQTDVQLFNFIATPLMYLLMLTLFLNIYNKKRDTYINFIIYSVILVCNCTISGGRIEIIQFLILYVICCFMRKNKKLENIINPVVHFNILYIIPFIVILIFISDSRGHGSDDGSILITIIKSYTLYVGIFNYYNTHEYIAFDDFLLGGSTFEGLITYFRMLLNKFLNCGIETNVKSNNYYIQEFVRIGPYLNANAHATMYFLFIRDFGYLGVVIGPLLLGIVCHRLYKKMLNKPQYFVYYLFMTYVLTTTTLSCHIYKLFFWITIVYYYFFQKYCIKQQNKYTRFKPTI